MKRDALPNAEGAASCDAPDSPRPTILVVDDTPAYLTLLAQFLNKEYRVLLAVNGAKALEIARRASPDLILLDAMMPELDGYEVCRRLKADAATHGIPVLFLTALTRLEDETHAFEAGAADFIQKPFNGATVIARVRTHVALKRAQDALLGRNTALAGELQARCREVERLRDATLFMMVSLAEFRDADTVHHVQRTQEIVGVLARWLAAQPGAPPELTPAAIGDLVKAAPLHDIGKIAIPDAVLLKPGPLDAAEWALMKTHAERGSDLLRHAVDRVSDDTGRLLRFGMQIARHHHERWDGGGYPDGLAGDAIPVAARLMAVADVYDAVISRRPYKMPMSHQEAMDAVRAGSGTKFDPRIVAALEASQREIVAIANHWADPAPAA